MCTASSESVVDHQLDSVCPSFNVQQFIIKRETPISLVGQSPLLSVQEAAAKLEHLFKKPPSTAKGAERTDEFVLQSTWPSAYRFHRLIREGGSCLFTGKVDIPLVIRGQAGEPDVLELAHIIAQSVLEGTKGVPGEARQMVGLLPETDL